MDRRLEIILAIISESGSRLHPHIPEVVIDWGRLLMQKIANYTYTVGLAMGNRPKLGVIKVDVCDNILISIHL